MLSIYCPIRPLLPNIQLLHWYSSVTSRSPYVALFLGPKLTSLYLCLEIEVNLALSLQGLAHLSPNVQTFTLGSRQSSAWPCPPEFCHGIACFTHLRELDLLQVSVNADTLVRISQLADLRSLKCHLAHATAQEFSSRAPTQAGVFHSLNHLELVVEWRVLDPLLNVIGLIQSDVLRTFKLSTPFILPRRSISRLCDKLGSHPSRHSIASVFLNLRLPFGHLRSSELPVDFDESAYTIELRDIRGLFFAPSIQIFHLGSPYIYMDDAALAAIASAWPHLRQLHFKQPYLPMSQQTDPAQITLSGLVTLLVGCPDLCSLALTVDAGEPHTPSSVKAQTRRFRSMHFDLQFSNITQSGVTGVTAFLSTFFSPQSVIFVHRPLVFCTDPLMSEEERKVWLAEADRRRNIWTEVSRWARVVSAARMEEAGVESVAT